MTLVQFIENRYQELKLETDLETKFNITSDSEMKAAHYILDRYRHAMTYVMVPKVIYDFVMVRLGKKKEPEPVILNMIKAQKEKEALEKEKLAPVESGSDGEQQVH